MADRAPAADAPRLSRAERIETMAREIARLADRRTGSPGEVAALRRLDPEHPDAAAFWRLLVKVDGPAMENPRAVTAWAMIAGGMARMAPNHHDGAVWPGRALAEVGVSEARLEQALRARGPHHTWRATRRLCDMLAHHAQPVDWRGLGRLLLAEAFDNDDEAERQRHHIARAYYTALHAE